MAMKIPSIQAVTTAVTIPRGATSVKVTNTGGGAGTVQGFSLATTLAVEFRAGDLDELGEILLNGTGTTLRVEVLR